MSARRLLIVSPHFPPVNAPDMQRVRQCLRHLPALGWQPEVLAVDASSVAAPTDPHLAAALPAEVPVHRVKVMSPRLGRWLGRGTLGRRAVGPLGRAGAGLLRARQFDMVYFSTTQFRVLTLGPEWRRAFGVPYAVDWQDPWLTDYYHRPGAPTPPGGWRYRFAHAEARALEGGCLRGACGWTGTSSIYESDLLIRYPWFSDIPRAVIPFGFEPGDYRLAGQIGTPEHFDGPPGSVHVVSVGAVGAPMRAALNVVFAAVRQVRESAPGRSPRLRLHFFGTSYAPPGSETPSVLPLAADHGVADLVQETPRRLRYFDALQTMRQADALLLLGSDDPGYSPSKIAAVAFAGRPVLACVGNASLAAALRQLGIEGVVETGAGDAAGVFAGLLSGPGRQALPDPGRLQALTAQRRTEQLAHLLDLAWRHSRDAA